MRSPRLLNFAGILGTTGVALGAFGAHALKERLVLAGTSSVWDKAVLYHLIHSVAILVIGLAASGEPAGRSRWLNRAGWLWTAGVLCFSGSLYGLALGGPKMLGPITPLGGLLLIAGWGCILIAGAAISDLDKET